MLRKINWIDDEHNFFFVQIYARSEQPQLIRIYNIGGCMITLSRRCIFIFLGLFVGYLSVCYVGYVECDVWMQSVFCRRMAFKETISWNERNVEFEDDSIRNSIWYSAKCLANFIPNEDKIPKFHPNIFSTKDFQSTNFPRCCSTHKNSVTKIFGNIQFTEFKLILKFWNFYCRFNFPKTIFYINISCYHQEMT